MIFPENIRDTCSHPLPNLKHLLVGYKDQKNPKDLEDFLCWCAPSLESLKTQIGRTKRVLSRLNFYLFQVIVSAVKFHLRLEISQNYKF